MQSSGEKVLPSISIITTSFNSNLAIFTKVLKTIEQQDYPKNLIEHIVVDGGSKNGLIDLATQFKCKIIIRGDLQEEINARMLIGVKSAKNSIIAIIETDNIPTNTDWLRRMIEPFLVDKKIFCTFNAYNSFSKNMSLLTKYCALFGISDPVLYYLGKSEKMSWHNLIYSKGEVIKRSPRFTTVRFTKNTLPTLGDNGCFVRRDAFLKTSMTEKKFIHLDLFYELLDKGYDTFAAVDIGIIHVTGSNMLKMIRRRLSYRKTFFEKRKDERKYLVYNPNSLKDKMNLVKFCLFTITLLEPFYESVRGFLKVQEVAWFLHPLMCYIFLIGYAKYEFAKLIKSEYAL